MSFSTGTRSVGSLVRKPVPRFARVVQNMRSVTAGLGQYPRSTMRQSGPIGGGASSVDVIQTNPAFRADPADPLPG